MASVQGRIGAGTGGPGLIFPTLLRGFAVCRLLAFETLLPTEVAAVFEHVAGIGMQGPVGALTGLVGGPGHLDEAVVEGE